MSFSDYQGRSYDVLAFQGVKLLGDNQLTQALATPASSGVICTGIEKLTQWFLLEFLTDLGSVPYDLDRGTLFMASFHQGHLRTEPDVFAAFALATSRVEAHIRSLAKSTDPLDEQFKKAELIQLMLGPAATYLKIEITSQAGSSRQPILPLTFAY